MIKEYIITYTGKKFFPLNPNRELIDIEDVSHSLPLINRWTGHTRVPWSVGSHTLAGYFLLDDPLHKLEFFLHDWSEAYIADIASPIKPHILNYKKIEDKLMYEVRAKHNLYGEISPIVKEMDKKLLVNEFLTFINYDNAEIHYPNYKDYLDNNLCNILLDLSTKNFLSIKEMFKEEYFKCLNALRK